MWKRAQSIARSLSLSTFSDRVNLVQKPVAELKRLRRKLLEFDNINLDMSDSLFENKALNGNTVEIEAEIQMGNATRFGFDVRKGERHETVIGYNAVRHELLIDRSQSRATSFSKEFTGLQTGPFSASSQLMKLHVFVDWSSVEAFADDGTTVMTDLIFPS